MTEQIKCKTCGHLIVIDSGGWLHDENTGESFHLMCLPEVSMPPTPVDPNMHRKIVAGSLRVWAGLKNERGVVACARALLDGDVVSTELLIRALESMTETDRAFVFSTGQWVIDQHANGTNTLQVTFNMDAN